MKLKEELKSPKKRDIKKECESGDSDRVELW